MCIRDRGEPQETQVKEFRPRRQDFDEGRQRHVKGETGDDDSRDAFDRARRLLSGSSLADSSNLGVEATEGLATPESQLTPM